MPEVLLKGSTVITLQFHFIGEETELKVYVAEQEQREPFNLKSRLDHCPLTVFLPLGLQVRGMLRVGDTPGGPSH